MAKRKNDSQKLAELVAKAMDDKKASDIRILDLREIKSAVTDYFIICHAQSSTQVQAIADNIDYLVKKMTGNDPIGTEGYQNAEWILVDYADVVAHVFNEEKRMFFGLEKLWGDAKVKKVISKETNIKSDLDF